MTMHSTDGHEGCMDSVMALESRIAELEARHARLVGAAQESLLINRYAQRQIPHATHPRIPDACVATCIRCRSVRSIVRLREAIDDAGEGEG